MTRGDAAGGARGTLRALVALSCSAVLALVAVGCGGSSSPPDSAPHLTGWEIDLTRPTPTSDAAPAAPAGSTESEGGAVHDSAPEPGYDVPVKKLPAELVPPPRSDQPSRGPADAPVLIQVFSDFECPHCARTAPLLEELEREFGQRVRVIWRSYPLPHHALANDAAVAALSVFQVRGGSAFWKAHDAIFEQARDGLAPEELEAVVAAQGGDIAKYRAALSSRSFAAAIQQDVAAGDAIGIEGTPAFLIGRYYLFGIAPLAVYRALIERSIDER